MTVSALPSALDALLAGLRANPLGDPHLEAAQVIDGPPSNDFELPVRALVIGASEDPDDVLAAGSESSEGGLGARNDEDIEIFCNAIVWDGGTDVDLATTRTTAFALLDAVGAYLASDRRLGGAVMRAALTGTRQYGQRRSSEGAGAVIAFSIRCTYRP